MVFSAFMMAAALAQAPVAPVPVNPATNQGRETVEQHLQCLTIVLLVGAAQKDQAKQAGMSGALGYYYGRIDALAPGTDIAANVRRLLPQRELLGQHSDRCGKQMIALGQRMQSDGAAIDARPTPPAAPPAPPKK